MKNALFGLVLVAVVGAEGALAQQPGRGDALTKRVERLETTVQVVRDYNDDFFAIVIWSLSAVAGLGALLVGASWFQSNRILRGEVDSLRSELRGLIETRFSEVETPLRERVSQALDANVKAIEAAASTAAKKALAPLHGAVSDLRRRVAELEYEGLEAEVDKWSREKVLSNALRAALKMTTAGIGLGHDFWVEGALDRVDSILKGLQAESRKLEAMDANETERVLESLGDRYKTVKNALLERLRGLQAL